MYPYRVIYMHTLSSFNFKKRIIKYINLEQRHYKSPFVPVNGPTTYFTSVPTPFVTPPSPLLSTLATALCSALVKSIWNSGLVNPCTTATLLVPAYALLVLSFLSSSLAISLPLLALAASWRAIASFLSVLACSMSFVRCLFSSRTFSRYSAALAALSWPPISATLKTGFQRSKPDSP